MFINTELLEFIRLKNPLSSVIGKYEVITNACCKCPFCHSKTNSLNLFHDEIYTFTAVKVVMYLDLSAKLKIFRLRKQFVKWRNHREFIHWKN